MSKLVLLDTGVLGLATNPSGDVNNAVVTWLRRLVKERHQPQIPETADYELRRELIRRKSINAINRLDVLGSTLGYIPIDTATMRRAAALWAQARNTGQPMAHNHALDGDVILCAQAEQLERRNPQDEVIVATTNVSHLARFVTASEWQLI
jgi:hypothetical protein